MTNKDLSTYTLFESFKREGRMFKQFVMQSLCLSFCIASEIQEMTLEEKIGQLLMVHFHGQIANDEACMLIQDLYVGGFIYYNWANGLHSPLQVQTLSSGLQKLAKIPLFIAVDQEGGGVARLTEGFTPFPDNKTVGQTRSLELAEQVAFAVGEELCAVGVNMNFAPVVDVASHPKKSIIGLRSFSSDPEEVTTFGSAALKGYARSGVIGTLKHFPGHGDVEIDSHEDLPVLDKSFEDLEKTELHPFTKLARASEVMMTAHLLVPALDPEHCSTLSKKTLTFLRETLGFQGVIISDSLVMEGVLKKCHCVDEIAIEALNAGCDILLLGGKQLTSQKAHLELCFQDIQRIHSALVEAVKIGRVPLTRIDQALERILTLKKRYLKSQEGSLPLELFVNTQAHRELREQIKAAALKVISE